MKLELITPVGIKLSEQVYEIVLPTQSGLITVLPGHEPLVTLLSPGVMMIRRNKTDQNPEHLAVEKGIVEINSQAVRVLTDEAVSGSEIIENDIKKAVELAQKMHAQAKNQVELEEAKKLLERHAVKLKVAELHRRHKRQYK